MVRVFLSLGIMAATFVVPSGVMADDDDLKERQIVRKGIDRDGHVRPDSELAKLTKVKVATSVNYRILLLEPDGKERSVPEDFEFKLGQQFRLEVEADSDLYLYVFHEGPDGSRTILMPDKYDNGRVPQAKKNEKKVIPDDGTYFEFVSPAGVEKLLVYANPQKRPELTPQEAFEIKDDADGKKKQLELKSAQDKIFSKAANVRSRHDKADDQLAKAPDDDVAIVFRGWDIPDDDGTTVAAGSTDESRKPDLFKQITLKSR